jgi:hypothetical protein
MLHSLISASRLRDRGSFISFWNTSNVSSGSTASNQIKLPLTNGGVYNFTVDWGDGSVSNITTFNQSEVTHTYASSGTYTLTIKGTINGFRFGNSGDRLKLMSIQRWGCFRLSSNAVFDGCTNLTLDAVVDILSFTGATTLNQTFRNCSSITTINNINFWNVSNIVTMNSTFSGCTLFNSSITNWNTPLVTDFNAFLYLCTAFNQDISNFSFVSCTTATLFMSGKTAANYSATFYDNLLIAMASQTFITNGWSIAFGSIKRTAASTTARNILTSSPKSLTITDGGI